MDVKRLEDVIALLAKPAAERKVDELEFLRAATGQIKFFQDLSAEVHQACCKALHLQVHPASSVIFHKGSPGDSFCIVLRGSVSVLVPQAGSRLSDISTLRKVAVLEEGRGFGELSLLQDRDRAATIVTREPTWLGVLGKGDFDRILRLHEERRLHKKIQFFKEMPAFCKWSDLELSRFTYYFKEEKCKRGTVVFTEGEESVMVYVVVQGEFRFTMKEQRHELQLLYKGPKEMFGEEDILSGRPRQCTCTCDSYEGRLYVISREDFLKFCQRDSTLRYLIRHQRAESHWLTERRPRILQAERSKLHLSLLRSPQAVNTSAYSCSSLKRDLYLHCNVNNYSTFALPQLSQRDQLRTKCNRAKENLKRLRQKVQRRQASNGEMS